MKARFLKFARVRSRARRASTVGLFLTLFASTAHAQGTAEQRRACTPEDYRLCAGEIADGRAVIASVHSHRAGLSEARHTLFDEVGG
jgi:hypothetical protein